MEAAQGTVGIRSRVGRERQGAPGPTGATTTEKELVKGGSHLGHPQKG